MFKKVLLIGAMICFLSCPADAQADYGEQVALKLADKLTDSLVLTNIQRDSLLSINLRLHFQKQAVWINEPSPDALRREIQIIENTRDSLYQPVLGEDKFQIYLTKKINLISAN